MHAALAAGAATVYASARTPRDWADDRVVPLALDVTDPASLAAAAEQAPDVSVLINNAGVLPPTASLIDISEEALRRTMEVNFFAPLLVARAFVPALAAAADGVLVDIHSVASWYAGAGVYSASRAALWSATNSLRLELAPRGIHVTGVHMSYVDTAMAAHTDEAKLTPAALVAAVVTGVQHGAFEIVADGFTAQVKAGLAGPIESLYPSVAPA
ncbi:SDR family oxidoreductase [Rathayibacter tanaceti]|uniref:3-oxoacyl-[acyl-carrier-protein] reductase FabG n=1 Tax=Rathayibacter tanaceti TaxID=1671680 RepID=A0A166H8M4_9MICO|nr:SDR family oxidoreductase [Rathayibacter tanaceti]KZX20142.1 3-oxoacyl-[acyl-carrier-protein] reductase FabG [Rathayibacter tanaceti]